LSIRKKAARRPIPLTRPAEWPLRDALPGKRGERIMADISCKKSDRMELKFIGLAFVVRKQI